MKPLLIGGGERRLFALLTPAEGPRQRRAVVLCPSLGQEYLFSHRSFVSLGRRLARAGFDVLRFDYYGTGDSAGTGRELRLEGAVDDACTAVREGRDMVAARSVAVVGLRWGAAVGAAACARSGAAVDRAVVWDPVVDGDAGVEELRVDAEPLPDEPGGLHARGFPFTAPLLEELGRVSPASYDDLPARVLLALSSEAPSHARLVERLGGSRELDRVLHPSPPSWEELDDSGAAPIPHELLRAVVEWLS